MTDSSAGYKRFFAELKRRRVYRVMAVYGIVGFLLLQIMDLVVPALLLPEWTYRFLALILLLGFPIALVLAWAFEMTPEGVRRTADAGPGELGAIIAAPAAKRWTSGLLGLVGISALVFGAWYAGQRSSPTPDADSTMGAVEGSIAVLPFVNVSDDASNEYFSDGISEELLNLLARMPDLRVAARTSSFSFKDQNLEIPEIADRLNVAHVLEGSVRKAGNQVRITAQLIRADDGFPLWSERWDRRLDDIFAIQDEIAAAVAKQLQVTLLGAVPTVYETDPEAYALFLQARHLLRTGGSVNDAAEPLLNAALEIDPEYVPALLALARVYNRRSFSEGVHYETLTRDVVNRALALDPENGYAHGWLGWIAIFYDGDLETGARETERGLALDPTHLDLLHGSQQVARIFGQFDAATALGRYEVSRDPVCERCYLLLGTSYLVAGNLDEAENAFLTAETLTSGGADSDGSVASVLGLIDLLRGDPVAAISDFETIPRESPRAFLADALVSHTLGRKAEFDAAVAGLSSRDDSSRWLAPVYAWSGATDDAFQALEANRLAAYRSYFLPPAQDPLYESLRADPRWLPYLESIGRSPEELAAIDFEVRLPQ